MKPGDFFLSVLDFFAILLPGSLATWLVTRYVSPEDILRYLSLGSHTADGVTLWVAFLLCSYVLGHFVFMAGSKLDTSYDRWRRRQNPQSRDKTFRAADDLRKKILMSLPESERFSTLKWAKSYIQIHSPEARIEIDRLEADSKFFRSLVVVLTAIGLHFLLTDRAPGMGVAFLILSVMAYLRFCEQRWKLTELSYATAVILHTTKITATEAVAKAKAG